MKFGSLIPVITNIILFISSLSLVGCGHDSTSNRAADSTIVTSEFLGIVGGRSAGPGIVYSTVGVYDYTTKKLCTGTLIAKNMVLTAAHCIGAATDNVIVLFGRDLANGTGAGIYAAGIKIHPEYGMNRNRLKNRFDLALVKISGDAPEYFVPMSLPAAKTKLLATETIYMAGYGRTQYQTEDAGNLKVVFRNGASSEPEQVDFSVDMSDGRGTCKGDSGGPLFIAQQGKFVLMGVDSMSTIGMDPVTHLPKKDLCATGAQFTNVVYFLDWIKQEALDL